MRTKERGSVVGYVLGAVLLLALLIGGIVLYKNYAGNLDKAPVVGQNNNETRPADESNSDDQAAKNEAALKQQQEEAERKAREQNEAASSTNNAGNTGTQNSTSDNSANSGTQNNVTQVPRTSTAPNELPTTGPAEDAMLLALGFSLVTGAAIAYRRSVAAL